MTQDITASRFANLHAGSENTSVLMDELHAAAAITFRRSPLIKLNSAWVELAERDSAYADWADLIHPEDLATVLRASSLAAIGTSGTHTECRILLGSGSYRWHFLQAHPLPASDIEERACLWIASDIHSKKIKEREHEALAARQTSVLGASSDCFKLIALDGTVQYMNAAGCRALGVPCDSNFGMPWLELLPADVRLAGERALDIARTGHPSRFPGRSELMGVATQYWDNMLTPVNDALGKPTSIVCISRDITAEHNAIESLRASRERLEIACRIGGLGIWDYEISSDTLICDASWYRIMGRDSRYPVRSIDEFKPMIHPEDQERATEVLQTATELIRNEKDYSIVFRIIRPSGDIRWVRSAARIEHHNGVPVRAVGFVTDITDSWRGELALRDANRSLLEEKESLARQLLEDPLTGIANRRHLDGELTRICLHAREERTHICVGMIDVDHFKDFNDRYGHLAGDSTLKAVAGAIQNSIRQADFAARYGGEEFAFVLSDCRDPERTIASIFKAVEKLDIRHEGSPTGRLTISCGCVILDPTDLSSPFQILKAGDDALYKAKRDGRDRFVIDVRIPHD